MATPADLRDTLDMFRDHGELAEVDGEVHWDRELGAVTREMLRRKGPALLYTNISGYQGDKARCGQLATSLLASRRRLSLVLGFDDEAPNTELINHVNARMAERVSPTLVSGGPVQENILEGDSIDLTEFPVPRWHHLDGGRYINTFAAVVTKDPDTNAVNVGVYRGMIAGPHAIAVLLVPSQHWGRHWAKYKERGEPMPVACVYGWNPVMDILAGSPIPEGVSEYEVMGAILGGSMPLVKCRTVDLEVPASAEIVCEGYIDPDPSTYLPEGPFGEFTGYVSDVPTPRPVMRVTCVTHRDAPIFRGTLEGSLPGSAGENSHISAVFRAAIAWQTLATAGVPNVLNVYVHPVTNGTNIVVQIRKNSEGHPKWVASALWGTGAALFRYKNVIVVDEDIDPSDYTAIDWAIAYRVRAGTDDVVMLPGSFGSPIDPSTPLAERSLPDLGTGLWNRVLIDATKTWRFGAREEWGGEKFPPSVEPAPEDHARVLRRWQEYGLGGF